MRFGIIGTGWMADKMVSTMKSIPEVELCAVVARDFEKAKLFAKKFDFEKVYSSIDEFLLDKDIEVIYITSPHSEHYAHAKMCLEANKNVLCEKPFTVNATQAKELFALAKEKDVFISEAFWSKCQPSRQIITDIIKSGAIGEPSMIVSQIGMCLEGNERIVNPALAGGALLDIGVYAISFAMQFFGIDIKSAKGETVKLSTGVDSKDSFSITWNDGKMASLTCSSNCLMPDYGMVCGQKGYIIADEILNPLKIDLYDSDKNFVKTLPIPPQINGYEYEIYETIKAIESGKKECDLMPHSETLKMIELMDSLRKDWDIKYPCE